MAIFNCKSCGGDLEIQEGTTVVTCEYCGRQQTVPSMDNEKKVNLFNRANRLRSKCDFDKAASVYESIVAEFPQESEAYWGLCLCKFGIEYVDDPSTANKIPTCHRTSYESIFDDQNFDMACEYADALAVNQLRNEAKEIDRLQKEILEIAKNEQPFDVFICYKESDDNGKRTVDSELAHDIYDVLTEKGYKVFYSRITLKAKLGQDYEPYIFSALNSAKVMLSIGTKYEYFNAVWVKNEWSRFLSLMKSDKSKMLIPCYRDIDPYDMPKEFGGLQGQDLSSPRAFQDLVTNIEKIIPKATSQPSATVASSATASVDSLLKRAFMCLEDGDWNGADKCCEKILDIDPENARAYLAKLCLELKYHRPEEIANRKQPLDESNSNYKKAMRFADEQFKIELEGYNNAILNRIDIERKNDIYNDAVKKMKSAITPSDFKTVKEIFRSISGFKDADKLFEECDSAETLKKEQIYEEGLKKMDSAQDVMDYVAARELFLSTNMFNDSKDLVKTCNEQIYHTACKLMKEVGSESKASQIANLLKNIKDYEDSEKLAALIEDGALEYYNKAKVAVRNNDYSRAEQLLSAINGFFDAGVLAQHCRNVIKQNGSKDSEDYKILQRFTQISGDLNSFNQSSEKPKKDEKPIRSEQTNTEIYNKASAFFNEGDYKAAESWFKKIPEYKDVKERLNSIEHLYLFSDSCKDIKKKHEEELSQLFKEVNKADGISKICRAVLISSCIWLTCFLALLICGALFEYELIVSLVIILALFITCAIASTVFVKKTGAPKFTALPITIIAIIAGLGVIAFYNKSFLSIIPSAAFLLIPIVCSLIDCLLKTKKNKKLIRVRQEIEHNLNSDIDNLKHENETIADHIKTAEINKIFGGEPWDGLAKPADYSEKATKSSKSLVLLFAVTMILSLLIFLISLIFLV